MEAGVVDENGDWTSDPETLEVGYGHLGPEAFLTTETFWSGKKFPTMYGAYFDNGKKLVELVGDVVEYLKSV